MADGASKPAGPRLLVPPKRDIRKPRLIPPPGACDTHFHIYFPQTEFPLRPDRRYTPVDATLTDYRRTMDKLGLSRGVVVTGAANQDNEPTLAAIARMGGAFKGVALVGQDVSDRELSRLNAGGMTAFRISTISVGGLSPAHIAPLAKRVADFGWHVEIHVHKTQEIIDLLPILKTLPIPYCLDHLAQLTPGKPIDGKLFGAIRDLLATDERCYVNLYGFYHVSKAGPPGYDDVVPMVRALIEARPEGVVWGSNWPHSSLEVPPPDEADLLDLLLAAAPDPRHQRLILSDNPARLYGWS